MTRMEATSPQLDLNPMVQILFDEDHTKIFFLIFDDLADDQVLKTLSLIFEIYFERVRQKKVKERPCMIPLRTSKNQKKKRV